MFEEKEKNKNRGLTFTILGIFVLLLTSAGIAIAVYTWNYTSDENRISTGDISMSLLESTDVISIENALPMSDTKGKQLGKNESFDFAVTTYASGKPGDINYSISITEDAVDEGYTKLGSENVKVYLTVLPEKRNDAYQQEIEVVAPTKVSEIIKENNTGNFTFKDEQYSKHSHTSSGSTITTKYRLRMWVDSEVDASDWKKDSDSKYQYKLKIGTAGSIKPIGVVE